MLLVRLFGSLVLASCLVVTSGLPVLAQGTAEPAEKFGQKTIPAGPGDQLPWLVGGKAEPEAKSPAAPDTAGQSQQKPTAAGQKAKAADQSKKKGQTSSGQAKSDEGAKKAAPASSGSSGKSDLVKSGTISFDYGQAAFILSGSGGKGVLTFKKKKYQIKLGGLGIGGIGGSKVQAVGEVYNMTSLAQFPGAYVQGRIGYAVGEGKGSLWLENTSGVILKLKAKTKGLILSLGGDALRIDFARK